MLCAVAIDVPVLDSIVWSEISHPVLARTPLLAQNIRPECASQNRDLLANIKPSPMHQDQPIAKFQLHLHYKFLHPLVRRLEGYFIKFVVAEDIKDFEVWTAS